MISWDNDVQDDEVWDRNVWYEDFNDNEWVDDMASTETWGDICIIISYPTVFNV